MKRLEVHEIDTQARRLFKLSLLRILTSFTVVVKIVDMLGEEVIVSKTL